MAEQLWSATIDRLGEFTAELFEGGCYILFGELPPEALAEVSIVHTTRQAPPVRSPQATPCSWAASSFDSMRSATSRT